jgi:hypothetical protein
MTEKTRAARGRGTASLLGLAVGVVVILAWAGLSLPAVLKAMGQPLTVFDAFGAIVVASLFMAGAVWLVLFLSIVGRTTPRRGPAYFGLLLACAFVAQMTVFNIKSPVPIQPVVDDRAESGVALRAMKSTADVAFDSKHGGAPIDVRPTAKGDAGVVEGIAKQFVAKIVADQESYRAELAALGFPGFMTPDRLAADRGLRSTRAKLAQAQTVVQKYRDLQAARLHEYRDTISRSSISDLNKQQILQGIDADYDANLANDTHIWDLESGILGEYQQAVEVLARTQGGWGVFGHKLHFGNAAAMQAFNAHVLRAKSLGAEEAALRAASRDKMNQDFSKAIDENARAQGVAP